MLQDSSDSDGGGDDIALPASCTNSSLAPNEEVTLCDQDSKLSFDTGQELTTG